MKEDVYTGKNGLTAAEELALLIERKRQENRALLKLVNQLYGIQTRDGLEEEKIEESTNNITNQV